jgi:hypothetical protein
MRCLVPPPPSHMSFRATLVACGLLGALACGCGRKVSEADCRKVAEHLGEVWNAEAKKEETDGPGKEKAVEVIRQEGERLTRDWMDECKKELVGKRVEAKELDCLLATKTMVEIQRCADAQ